MHKIHESVSDDNTTNAYFTHLLWCNPDCVPCTCAVYQLSSRNLWLDSSGVCLCRSSAIVKDHVTCLLCVVLSRLLYILSPFISLAKDTYVLAVLVWCILGCIVSDLVCVYSPSRQLRSSSDSRTLRLPYIKTKTFGYRSFSHAAPSVWNSLPHKIGRIRPSAAFKTALESHLFRSYLY